MKNNYSRSEKEIEALRKAGRVVGRIHYELRKMIKPNVSLASLNKRALEIIKEMNAKPSFLNLYGFPYAICTSVNNCLIHGFATDYLLKKGDLISIDAGAEVDNYHADAAFTEVVEEYNNEIDKNLVETTRLALKEVIEKVKVGMHLGDIGYIVENIAKTNGFFVTRDYCGHGIGINVHEDPMVPNFGKKGEGEKIVHNMVIAVEPMLLIGSDKTYVDINDNWHVYSLNGKNTAHEEHTLLFTNKGCEILTKYED